MRGVGKPKWLEGRQRQRGGGQDKECHSQREGETVREEEIEKEKNENAGDELRNKER